MSEKRLELSVDSLPLQLRTDKMRLNKCKAYLLKLNIPFISVMHLPRSADFKVMGPMICVEGKVEGTMKNLLPQPQRLVPVALKQSIKYSGSYVAEMVNIKKLESYYDYFKNVTLFVAKQS